MNKDVRVSRLSGSQAHSLTSALLAAAIVASPDPVDGAVAVHASGNSVFSLEDVLVVVAEWALGDRRRQPVIELDERSVVPVLRRASAPGHRERGEAAGYAPRASRASGARAVSTRD